MKHPSLKPSRSALRARPLRRAIAIPALLVPTVFGCSNADSQVIQALEPGASPGTSEHPNAGTGALAMGRGGASGPGAEPSASAGFAGSAAAGAFGNGGSGPFGGAGGATAATGEDPTAAATATTNEATGEVPATGPGQGTDTDTGAPQETADDPGSDPTPLETDRSEAATCARWNNDHADLSEGMWSGSVDACDPGDISEEGRQNALRLYNLYRWLADLPPVETSPERNRLAQACALLMEANGQLSHSPGMDWKCWTEAGAEGAGGSNISTGSSVAVVNGYMVDPGNETTLGHRRWILSNSLGPIGIGSTGNGASCMQNLGGQGEASKEWVAWPAPGPFPLQAYRTRFRVTLSETGWSVQSDSIDLSDAQVRVTSEGAELPVSVTPLQRGYGSRYAFRFNPEGWEPEANRSYAVSIEGLATNIAYEVRFVDCD